MHSGVGSAAQRRPPKSVSPGYTQHLRCSFSFSSLAVTRDLLHVAEEFVNAQIPGLNGSKETDPTAPVSSHRHVGRSNNRQSHCNRHLPYVHSYCATHLVCPSAKPEPMSRKSRSIHVKSSSIVLILVSAGLVLASAALFIAAAGGIGTSLPFSLLISKSLMFFHHIQEM